NRSWLGVVRLSRELEQVGVLAMPSRGTKGFSYLHFLLQTKEAVKVKRSSIVVACSVVFFFSLMAYAASPAVTAGARAVDEAWVKAMTGNDLNAVMACYSRDAVMWLPEAPEAKGHEAIR